MWHSHNISSEGLEGHCAKGKNLNQVGTSYGQRFGGVFKRSRRARPRSTSTEFFLGVSSYEGSKKESADESNDFQMRERNIRLSVIVPDGSSRNQATLKRSRYMSCRTRFNVHTATDTWHLVPSVAFVDRILSLRSKISIMWSKSLNCPRHLPCCSEKNQFEPGSGVPRPISMKEENHLKRFTIRKGGFATVLDRFLESRFQQQQKSPQQRSRARSVKTTPQMTRFRDAKVCNNLLQIRIDDHRIQSDFKYKSELQNQKERRLYLVLRLRGETEHDTNDNVTIKGITSAWWNRARHQWQRDHQDPEHLQHSAHEHCVSAQFSCLLVRFLSQWFTHCLTWLKGVAHVISSKHEKSVSLRPWVFHSLLLPLLLSHPLLLALLHFFHYLEGRSKPVHSV